MKKDIGISSQQAKQALSVSGFNELTVASRKRVPGIFLSQFANFLVVLLFFAAAISFLLGDLIDGFFILAIVVLNAALGFVQEYRAEKAIAALKKLTVAKTTVIRDGIEQEIDSKLLVPGDVIKIEEGDKIAADSKLLSAIHLEVNEASLTGESLPVSKKPGEKEHDEIFMGTIVVRGRGVAQVIATGMRTRFGRIAANLAEIEDPPTPLQKQLGLLGRQLGAVAVVASSCVLLLGLLREAEFFEMLVTSISLAVAAVPEGLPAVITITLAVGVHRMVRERAIVRKMAAIEALGATSLIATDKTGTITKNEMRVRELFVDGELRSLTHGKLVSESLIHLLTIGVLANTASLVFKHDRGGFAIIGDPTEGALLLLAQEFDLEPGHIREQGEIIDEFSFDSVRKTMSVVWSQDGEQTIFVKGAPETVLAQSVKVLHEGKEVILGEEQRVRIENAFEAAAKRGFRIIAMAEKKLKVKSEKLKVRDRDDVEADLTFVGFAALSDPPRPEIKEAARQASLAGISTVMITGDNELTANAIAQEVGLILENEEILTGPQLNTLTDEELEKMLPLVRIFARTTPDHKYRIVKAYQRLGHTVCVTGDGVNDALALKQANVGVAMGIVGTDVAKEAADVIVTDDNYATIVKAVEEGRVIFDNIVKSVVYLASGNLSELLIIFLAVVVGFPLPLVPVQILWINLVTDGLPALALAVDPKEPSVMRRKPRDPMRAILHKENIRFVLAVGWAITALVLALFALSLQAFSLEQARTIAFTTLIVSHMGMAFLIRKNTKLFSNRFLVISVAIVIILQAFILLVPALHPIFKVSPLW